MKLRRIISVLLIIMIMLSATSCGFIIINDVSGDKAPGESESEKDPEKDNDDESQEYVKYEGESNKENADMFLAELPKRDFEGAVFFITTPSAEYIYPEDVENPVSQLAAERNEKVESLLNISIVTSVKDSNMMITELKDAIASGLYYTDLLMVPVYLMGQYRMDKSILNLRTMPFFDFDQPYFNYESSQMTSGGYSTYGIAGHASISPSSYSAVYMNKDILALAGIDAKEVYKKAEEGNWTWDDLLGYSSAVSGIYNSAGNTGEYAGYHTVTAQNTASRLPDLIFNSCGHKFINAKPRTIPTVGYELSDTKKTLEIIYEIYNDEYAITSDIGGAIAEFSEGRSAFLIDYLSVMPNLDSSSADWGILPLPKEEESDDYRMLIANTDLMFAVPKNHTNTEYAAITLSALNAASYGYIYDEYVEYSMHHYLRDNESIGMLDLILDTANFDFAFAFGNAYPEIGNATYKLLRECAKTGNIEYYYESRVAAANAAMKTNFALIY